MIRLAIFSVVIFIIFSGCKSGQDQSLSDQNNLLKNEDLTINRKDTLLNETQENSKPELLYSELFNFSEEDRAQYEEQYNSALAEYDSAIVLSASQSDFVKKWIMLLEHSGKFYFERSCENDRRWMITDSSLVNYYQDGPAVEVLLRATRFNNDYFINTSNGTYSFKLKDGEKHVFVLNDGTSEVYVVSQEFIGNFPVTHEKCE